MTDAVSLSNIHAAGVSSRPMRGGPLIIIVLTAILVRMPFLSAPGFPPDQHQFLVWAAIANERGWAGLYEEIDPSGRRRCNYPPLYVLMSWSLGRIYPLISGHPLDREVFDSVMSENPAPFARTAFTLFKLPAVLADVGIALAIYTMLRRRLTTIKTNFSFLAGMTMALNPALIYNSAIYAQVDSIVILFMLLCLDAAARRRLTAMSVWLALALLTKPQAMLLLPLCFAAVWYGWPPCNMKIRAGRVFKSMAIMAGIAVLVIAPFGRAGLPGIRDAYTRAVGFYPVVHLNGFSTWFLVNPLPQPRLQDIRTAYQRDDVPLFSNITPRHLGITLLIATTAYALWRLRQCGCDDESLHWAACLLPIAFFSLTTQMHERYLLPAVVFCGWAVGTRLLSWLPLLIASVVGFLNIAWTWPGPASAAWSRPLARAIHFESLGMLCALAVLFLWIHLLWRGPAKLAA